MVRWFSRWLFPAVIAGIALFHPGVARAGCFTTCDIELNDVFVEPNLGCLTVGTMESECICGVSVSIRNGCTTNVTGDFECDELGDCSTLAPGESSSKSLGVRGNGFRRWVVPVTNEGVEHRVMVEATVSNYDASPGACGCPGAVGAAPREKKPGALALASFPLWFLVWRRRAKKTTRS